MNLGSHPFTLRQLQYAVAVADTLGFRAAAERCHVSQPSLSAQLALLEEALGVRLFERNRQRVLITTAGAALVERARAVLQATEDLIELARAGDPLTSTLRIGVIPTISPYLLPTVTAALRRRFRQLTVLWIEEKTSVLLHRLERGDLDAALIATDGDDEGDLDGDVVGFDPFVLATPFDHVLGQSKKPAQPAELRHCDVLLLDDGHCFRAQALEVCSSARAHELEFRATSLSTLAQMVAGGAGVTLLPQMAVATEARRARLRIRTFAAPVPGRTVTLVWRRRSPLAAALSQIAAAAREAWPTTTTRTTKTKTAQTKPAQTKPAQAKTAQTKATKKSAKARSSAVGHRDAQALGEKVPDRGDARNLAVRAVPDKPQVPARQRRQ